MKMMKKLAAFAGICILITYTSCTGGGSGFTTKEDSLSFAKAYFKKYPNENSVIAPFGKDSLGAKNVFGPITWDQVVAYKSNYDKTPVIFSPEGVALKGFMIDSTGYSMVQRNKRIQGLYLRMGKKTDGSFIIMLLGLDASGKVLMDGPGLGKPVDSSYYDNAPSCPDVCPLNFE